MQNYDYRYRGQQENGPRNYPGNFTVHYPVIYQTLALVITGILLIVTFVLPIVYGMQEMDIGIFQIVLSIFPILSILLWWSIFRWKIIVDNKNLNLTPIFGRTRSIHLMDISYIHLDVIFENQQLVAYGMDSKKLFSALYLAENYDCLVNLLQPLIVKEEQRRIDLRYVKAAPIINGVMAGLFSLAGVMAWAVGLWMALIPVIPLVVWLLLNTIHIATYRIILYNGMLVISSLLVKTRSIPIYTLRYGKVLYDDTYDENYTSGYTLIGQNGKTIVRNDNRFAGFTLVDQNGRTVVKISNQYVGYQRFKHALDALGVTQR